MKASYQLTESLYLKQCKVIRRNDKGRALDYLTGTIFALGLPVGAYGYYLFGPNMISHGTVAFFMYWFGLRLLVLRQLRKRAFKKLAGGEKDWSFVFSDKGVVVSFDGGEERLFSWPQLTRVIASDDGFELDAGKEKFWLPSDSFQTDEGREEAYKLLSENVSSFRKM